MIVRFGGSDLICKSETVPKIRLRGALKKLETQATTTDQMFQIAKDILDDKQYGVFARTGRWTSPTTSTSAIASA